VQQLTHQNNYLRTKNDARDRMERKITGYGKWKRWDKKWDAVLEFESEINLTKTCVA